jgi:hypothetical protein
MVIWVGSTDGLDVLKKRQFLVLLRSDTTITQSLSRSLFSKAGEFLTSWVTVSVSGNIIAQGFSTTFFCCKLSYDQGSTVGGGWQPFCISPETAGWRRTCETGRCHGEAARSVLARVRGDIARFHAVAAKRRSRTGNSQFGLFGPVFCATTTDV